MKKLITIAILVLTLALLSAGEFNEYYFRFELKDRSLLTNLGQMISIDKVEGFQVYAYANDNEWKAFLNTGLSYQLLPHPGINPNAIMANSKADMRAWDSYPTYEAYISMMYDFAQDYPNLCRIVDVGTTVGGRNILFAVISDNVQQREAEPRLMYTATMHGDETVGYILMLRLIDTLLAGYGTDPRLSNLVNNAEIWINPNANPDGTYYGGNSTVSNARRYNQNGYDLNRNFPDPNGSQYSGQPLQTETSLMMALGMQERFHLVANLHGGAEVVNYPWDHKYDLHVDDAWYQSISRAFATSAQNNSPSGYLDDLNNGITNGAEWYVTTGNRQDWTNYAARGREVTIELSNTKNPDASTLPDYWTYNYDALLGYLEQGLYGIHGIVKDAWNNPLPATISVLNHDDNLTTVESIAANGTFYRYLSPGSYDIKIATNGYDDIIVEDVVVSTGLATPLEVIFGTLPEVLELPLAAGWNQVSFNVLPENPADIISSISNLIQIKDMNSSYNPIMASQFNTLNTINPANAYYVKVSAPSVLHLEGTAAQGIDIPLKQGWNYIPYLPQESLSVQIALGSIINYVQDLRLGNLSWSASEITQMQPGKGYWVLVDQDCQLNYPE
ncbi:MAG: carboxypeptidase regulatory-like domain-containing protein [Candidatus Cloacimonetes bacterium]|nr:carboxypeptidase regulatory-like domain-containing protein [Candidatus Cloacimonadota bacterium]